MFLMSFTVFDVNFNQAGGCSCDMVWGRSIHVPALLHCEDHDHGDDVGNIVGSLVLESLTLLRFAMQALGVSLVVHVC